MALSKYASNLVKWLDRYKITVDQLVARIPLDKQRGTVIKAAIAELQPLELDAPGNFVSSALTEITLTLAWDAVTNATGYIVKRATNQLFTSNVTQVYSGSARTCNDSGLTANKKYYYKVYAQGTGDTLNEDPANVTVITVTTNAALPAPATLVAAPVGQTTATLTWDAVVGATSYMLERSTAADFTTGLTTVYTGARAPYSQTGLSANTHYYYRVHGTAAGHVINNYALADFTTTA